MDAIIRNLQIDLIMDNPNPIIDIFNGIWDQLSVCEINVYHQGGNEFVYYDKNNEWIFYIDIDNVEEGDYDDRFFCSATRYFDMIDSKIIGNYATTRKITQIMLENKLNITLGDFYNEYDYGIIQPVIKNLKRYL